MSVFVRLIALPPLAAGAIAAAPPPTGDESQVLAERRLRACLETNASARHGDLAAAVTAARAACQPQIDDARDVRVLEATAGLDPAEAQVVERRVNRKLNDEIARAVANFTGLAPTNAHD